MHEKVYFIVQREKLDVSCREKLDEKLEYREAERGRAMTGFGDWRENRFARARQRKQKGRVSEKLWGYSYKRIRSKTRI